MANLEFYNAYFIDNEKNNVEVLWKDMDNKDTFVSEVIEADENHPDFQKVLEHTTIDELHETTFQFIKDQRKKFEQDVLEIARRESLIETTEKVNKADLLLEIILQEEVDKEMLFKIKLALFEHDKIKNSDDRALKTRLRKAATIAEAIGVFSEA